MGDFSFSRIEDMFEFFRNDSVGINPSYWSQKLQSVDKYSNFREFSSEKFNEILKQEFNNWTFENAEDKETAWDELTMALLDRPESVESAIDLLCNYRCPFSNNEFVDGWDHDFTEYTYKYIFCCRAIPWAIKKYDDLKREYGSN